jgi:hypothetical protein
MPETVAEMPDKGEVPKKIVTLFCLAVKSENKNLCRKTGRAKAGH